LNSSFFFKEKKKFNNTHKYLFIDKYNTCKYIIINL